MGFFGYGVADAGHWFISMEEGGGTTEEEIGLRLGAWDARGRRELEEIDEYHRAIGLGKWFSPHPPIQKTWAASIRIVLAMDGLSTAVENVRIFQRDSLARRGGKTRLSPLFPLPSMSLDHWKYSEWSGATELKDRASYKQHVEAARVTQLAESVGKFRPRTVVFFGSSYLSYWERIAGVEFTATPEGLLVATSNGTRFIVCKHPATQGMTNAYFLSAAAALQGA